VRLFVTVKNPSWAVQEELLSDGSKAYNVRNAYADITIHARNQEAAIQIEYYLNEGSVD